MAESQAAVFRTFGVHVTCVEPGAIKTNFMSNVKRPDMAAVPAEYHAPLQSTAAAAQGADQPRDRADLRGAAQRHDGRVGRPGSSHSLPVVDGAERVKPLDSLLMVFFGV